MNVKILFFATLREHVGSKAIALELPTEMTVAMLKELLVKKYPRMRDAQKSIMAAVNGEYAADELIIPIDAEIAFFPPVSGG